MMLKQCTKGLGAALLSLALGSAHVQAQVRTQPSGSISGLDVPHFERTTSPADDLYRHVNGYWLDNTPIPPDRARYSGFDEVQDATQLQLRALVEDLLKQNAASGTDARKIRDLYNSFMDEARLDALGGTPLRQEFARIDALRDRSQLPITFARLARAGIDGPFIPYVHQDNRDSTRYVMDLYQSGIGLPDRDYYLKDGGDGSFKKIREAYRQHIVTMLKLAGDAQAAMHAEQIYSLEVELATAHWDKVVNRDPVKLYNKYPLAELPALAPGFDWEGYLSAAGVSGRIDYLMVSQPSYLSRVAELLAKQPLSVWKQFLKWQVLSAYAPYLSKPFVEANFEFNGTMLKGIPEDRPRWKRGLTLIEGAIGEGMGKLYVDRHFPSSSKQRMEVLVRNLIESYRHSIDSLSWMSHATKPAAHDKLNKLVVKIGYPDRFRDYSRLTIRADDLIGNVRRARQFEYQRNIDKLGKPIDRGEWMMTPQTVNAYYNPELNEIVFPAAILQPPFFHATADDAVNYGGIGAVIGHEISHGFDDQGSQYDGNGNLYDWFSPEDHQRYKALTRVLVSQYAAYEMLPGFHINGELTLGENIADVAGVAIAYKAYKLSLRDQTSPVLEGLTGEQRYFAGWAQVWRQKIRDKEAIRLLTTDPHSPAPIRVRAAVMNFTPFYEAFGVKPGNRMYLTPEQRVTIW